mgnify:CR=1 FL=1
MGKSGRDLGQENVERLQRYLEALRETGEGLPSRAGKANMTAIALAAGLKREVFYQNPQCRHLVEAAVAELGLRGIEARGTSEEDPRAAQLERRLTSLEQRNAALVAENHELRRRLKQLEHIEEHIVSTGRRVVP